MGCSPSKIQDGASPVSHPVVKPAQEPLQDPATNSPAQTKVVAEESTEPKSCTEEHEAACKVQSVYRGHVARKHVDGMRAEQQHQSPGLEAAHEGEETHAPYVASGGASVSHDVNDIQTGVGNADVTAAVPDDNAATADPSTAADDSAAAVVEIFGEEGASAVAAAFFDGDMALDAGESVQADDTHQQVSPADTEMPATTARSSDISPERRASGESTVPAEDAETAQPEPLREDAGTAEAAAAEHDVVPNEIACAKEKDENLDVMTSPENLQVTEDAAAAESIVPAETTITHDEASGEAPNGETCDNLELSAGNEAVEAEPTEMAQADEITAPIDGDAVSEQADAVNTIDTTLADEDMAEES